MKAGNRIMTNVQHFFVIAFLCAGCSIQWTQRYEEALNSLDYQHKRENLQKIEPAELKRHPFVVYNKDTIRIISNRKNFGFRDKQSNQIFLFQFGRNDTYITITCDSNWQVLEKVHRLEDVY